MFQVLSHTFEYNTSRSHAVVRHTMDGMIGKITHFKCIQFGNSIVMCVCATENICFHRFVHISSPLANVVCLSVRKWTVPGLPQTGDFQSKPKISVFQNHVRRRRTAPTITNVQTPIGTDEISVVRAMLSRNEYNHSEYANARNYHWTLMAMAHRMTKLLAITEGNSNLMQTNLHVSTVNTRNERQWENIWVNEM